MIWKQALISLCAIFLLAGCGNLSRPMDFHFDTQYNVAQNSTITSNTVTILGNQFAGDISIVNGTYSIDGGAYTSDPGKIKRNQTLTVQQTSAATISTATVTTVTVSGYTTTFTSITSSTLTFTPQSGVFLSSLIESNALTLPAALAASAAISIQNGEYSVSTDNGTTWSTYGSTDGTVGPGQLLKVRHTSSATADTDVTTSVTVAGITGAITFTTHTGASFSFTTQSNVDLSATVTSDSYTLPSYLASGTSISVSGGQYAIDGGSYTTAAGTVGPSQQVTVRQTSSANSATSTVTTLTVGSTPITFTSKTKTIVTDASGKIEIMSFVPSPSVLNSTQTSFTFVAQIVNTDTTSANITVYWQGTNSSGTIVTSGSFTTTLAAGQTSSAGYPGTTLLTTDYNNVTTWTVTSIIRN